MSDDILKRCNGLTGSGLAAECAKRLDECNKLENAAQKDRCRNLISETIPQVSENPESCYVRIQNGLKMPYMGPDAVAQCFNSCVKFAKDFKAPEQSANRNKKEENKPSVQLDRSGSPKDDGRNRVAPENRTEAPRESNEIQTWKSDCETKFDWPFRLETPIGNVEGSKKIPFIKSVNGRRKSIELNIKYSIKKTESNSVEMRYTVSGEDMASPGHEAKVTFKEEDAARLAFGVTLKEAGKFGTGSIASAEIVKLDESASCKP